MGKEIATLVDIFDHSTSAFAGRPLFGTKKNGDWEWMTYRAFGECVGKARAGLTKLGLARGDAVAIISNNRVEWAITAYAAFSMGVRLVPMYEAQLDKDWEFIVRDSKAKVLIVSNKGIADKTKKLLDVVPTLKKLVCLEASVTKTDRISTWDDLLDNKPDAVPPLKVTVDDIACIIYTSGTTANPKGVVLSHGNICSNVTSVNDMFPIGPEDRSLSFLPWAHSFGQTCELHALVSVGASMGLAESVDKIIDNLAEVRPTLLFSVPRIFNKIYAGVQKQLAEKPAIIQSMVRGALRASSKIRDGQTPSFAENIAFALANKLVFSKVRARFGGRLKFAFSGGAAISKEVAEFIDGLGIVVYEGYGLTETSPIATTNRPGARKLGTIGPAIPGVEIVIDPEGGRKTDSGYPEGEIIVFGPNVMQEYYNRPDDNAAVFCTRDFKPWPQGKPWTIKERGFRTGDMGFVDKDGFVAITGRIKEQYKLENGKYVVPTPLEEELKLSPFVANVMVYGDNKPFNVALLVANVQAVRDWASREGVSVPSDSEKLLADAKVRDLFKAELKKHGEKFKGFESVHDFTLIAEDFTTENGMLTPKMSLKRRAVIERYGSLIDGLYKKKAGEKSQEARA